ncbi:hypothetical protein [Reinekea sp. G2M2-21]|uniref:hypothetical protein n=1 Tax=Reinekea sp. G2M2-21 TaxID=2788942 RepID=UPI0018A9D021|nr:hypothetical protein [Reinekea sp. G2M2-21]
MDSYKSLKELSFKQKMQLQNLYKKEASGEAISQEEQDLLDALRDEWQQASRQSSALKPIIILLLIAAAIRVFYPG